MLNKSNITVEFVEKWIENHHLTRKSYETVLSDTLTNNGHYYIDNPYLRDWIKENKIVFRDLLPHELNKNQKIVLEHLKKLDIQSNGDRFLPFEAIENLKIEWDLLPGNTYLTTNAPHLKAYGELNRTDQYQVLATYSEWGLKEVTE